MSRSAATLAALALALLLTWIVAAPLLLVFVEALRGPGGWSLDVVRQFASRPGEAKALAASGWISAASVLLAALVGIPLALLFDRLDFPGRKLLGALVALPAVLPPLVGVVAFLFLWGETGFVAKLVQGLSGLEEPPWRLEGPGAILLVHAYSMYVYFYLFTRAGLAGLDRSELEAAASLGAGKWRSFLRVTLPHLRPFLAGAALLTFMTSLASYSAPYVFGGGFRVMTTQIVSTRLNGDERLAMVETSSLTLVALAGLALLTRLEGTRRNRGGSKGTPPAPRRIESTGLRLAATLGGWGLAAILLAPHATLLLLSFVPPGSWTTEPIPPAFGVSNYLDLFREAERLRPLLNSLVMAAAACGAAVGVALATGALAARRTTRLVRMVETLTALPWAVPGTVFAIALASWFGVHAPVVGRFVLIGTVLLLPLAWFVRNLPIASRPIVASFRSLDPSHSEAAVSLGATPVTTFLRVTLPLLRPAIAAGASLAFVTGLGDFVTSVVLYTYDTRPISLEILSNLRQANVGGAAAQGVVLMVLSAVAFRLGAIGERAR